jgi:hypothetical protein
MDTTSWSPVVPTTSSTSWHRESPWLLGVLGGWLGLWWRGYAFVPLSHFSSYDWQEYVPSAWMVVHGQDLGGYATWRNPLYPGMLGGLGELIGYNQAGWIIASISLFAVVFGAGLGARALAGPWAGMVAAAIIPFINPWAEASRWATLYPVLTACTALSLGAGAAMVRWPRLHWALLAGLSAGIGWGIDFRGGALVAAVLMLMLMALQARPRRWQLPLTLALAAALGPLLNHNLAVADQRGTDTAVGTQRALELRLAVESGDAGLVAACTGAPTGSAFPTPSTFVHPCGRAFIADNLDRLEDQAPFGVGLMLCLLPLVLLPGRRGRRDSLTALVVFGCAWGTLAVMGVWARLNVHHFVQFAAPIAMTVPVAVARLLALLGPWGRRLIPALALGAVGWVGTQGPWAGQPVSEISSSQEQRLLGQILTKLATLVQSEDVLLDCSGFGIEAAVLPRRFHGGVPHFGQSITHPRCRAWIQQPEPHQGSAWLLTREEPGDTALPSTWSQATEWRDGPRHVQLWRHVDTRPGRR